MIFAFKMMNCVLEMMDFVVKMMILIPGMDPSNDFLTILEQVRSEGGKFNWILANPEPGSPSFHEAGTGSLPEMREYLHPELVLYGLVRMAFGCAYSHTQSAITRINPRARAGAGAPSATTTSFGCS